MTLLQLRFMLFVVRALDQLTTGMSLQAYRLARDIETVIRGIEEDRKAISVNTKT